MDLGQPQPIERSTAAWPARCVAPFLLALIAIAAATACSDTKTPPPASPTPRPIPSPVTFPQETAPTDTLGDPTLYYDQYLAPRPFTALPGATVDAGRLGGSIYQIEVPHEWNGRLVLYVKPNDSVGGSELTLHSLPIRSYLIRNGFAWGQSSGSSNAVDGAFPEEIAALWDFFAQTHGRPQWTYLVGMARSAPATRAAVVRYPDRFDGALTLCGQPPDWAETDTDLLVAGAFAAGVTQAEFDTTEISDLVNSRIRPVLEDPAARARFEDIIIQLSGGPRPFAREGLYAVDPGVLWSRAIDTISWDYMNNIDRVYSLRGAAGMGDAEFNAGVVRRAGLTLPEGDNDYDLNIPLLTLNTTGSSRNPLSGDQQLRRKMEEAGRSDLLVQRTVPLAWNCGFLEGEWPQGLADLVAWVEQGKKPAGEDLLADDLTDIGRPFTLLPYIGSLEWASVAGSDQRLTLSGDLTLDGQPLIDANLWFEVVKDGVMRTCQFEGWFAAESDRGRYKLALASDTEAPGCGGSGAHIYPVMYSHDHDQFFVAQEVLAWPTGVTEATLDASFLSENPNGAGTGSSVSDFLGSRFWGVVLDASGEPMPPGTAVEAYIGDALCGRYVLPFVSMHYSPSWEAATYSLNVSSPALKPACTRDAPIAFRVNGELVPQTAKNTLALIAHELDLQLEE